MVGSRLNQRIRRSGLDPIGAQFVRGHLAGNSPLGMRIPAGGVVRAKALAHLHDSEHSTHVDVTEGSHRPEHRDAVLGAGIPISDISPMPVCPMVM